MKMPVAMKAQWVVQAGILPGEARGEYSQRWVYTTEHQRQDEAANPGGINPAYHSLLAKMRAEALDYYLLVSLPHLNNWARLDFTWY